MITLGLNCHWYVALFAFSYITHSADSGAAGLSLDSFEQESFYFFSLNSTLGFQIQNLNHACRLADRLVI